MGQGDGDVSIEWMSARDTLELVGSRNGHAEACQSIAARAAAGLLRTHASHFFQEHQALGGEKQATKSDDVDLPLEFWWANGGLALTQDWAAGDFSTWIDQRFEWRAFGVHFERRGVEAMLAPEIIDTNTHMDDEAQFDEPGFEENESRPAIKSRQLTHDHPYAAAKAALELVDLTLKTKFD